MNFSIIYELNRASGLSRNELDFLKDPISSEMNRKDYSPDIETVWILIVCRPFKLSQRMIFRKAAKRLEYDIILDFEKIQSAPRLQKLLLVPSQMITETSIVCARYSNVRKMQQFFRDFEEAVNLAAAGLSKEA